MFGAAIPTEDFAVLGDAEDGVGGVLDDGGEAHLGLAGLLDLGEVGDDGAEALAGAGERLGGDVDRDGAAAGGDQPDLGAGLAVKTRRDQVLQFSVIVGADHGGKIAADDLFKAAADHAGEGGVAVENGAVRGQDQRPFGDGFDESAIGLLIGARGENAFTIRGGQDECIDLAAFDGGHQFGNGAGAANRLKTGSPSENLALRVDVGMGLVPRYQVKAHQHPVGLGHVADDAPERQGQLTDERGGSDDLGAAGQLGLLVDVDNVEFVAPLEVLFADRLQIRDGGDGAGVEPATKSRSR